MLSLGLPLLRVVVVVSKVDANYVVVVIFYIYTIMCFFRGDDDEYKVYFSVDFMSDKNLIFSSTIRTLIYDIHS